MKATENTFELIGKEELLNSQEFFDLMQSYRMADMLDQGTVVKRFEAIKDWIKANFDIKK